MELKRNQLIAIAVVVVLFLAWQYLGLKNDETGEGILINVFGQIYRIGGDGGGTGGETAVNVGVYSDQNGVTPLTSIDYGTITVSDADTVQTYIIYIKNSETVPVTLTLSVSGWSPANAKDYLTLSWDYDNTLIQSGEIRKITLTLLVSRNTNFIQFSFTITINTFLQGGG